jgi:PII-like signaling protein
VTSECLKLTSYFGERDRAGDAFLADALSALYARHAVTASIVMRGAEGFGAKHSLHTDRLLTLSEDLPIVSVAVDAPERIEAVQGEVEQLRFDGLVTLERAHFAAQEDGETWLPGEEAKLTVYLGRRDEVGGAPAHKALVELFRRHGIAGASVLLGVDGTVRGERRRARFFAANASVPMIVIAVGRWSAAAGALAEVRELLGDAIVTVEKVSVCKRDGERLAGFGAAAAAGSGEYRKLMVYTGEQSRHGRQALHHELIRRLRAAGASGATSLRGVWGYHGEHAPHGDTVLQLRRRVPIVTVIVDEAGRIGEWLVIVDELTSESGLVTSELVPEAWRRSRG